MPKTPVRHYLHTPYFYASRQAMSWAKVLSTTYTIIKLYYLIRYIEHRLTSKIGNQAEELYYTTKGSSPNFASNKLLFPPKLSENHGFSHDFRGNKS